MISVLCPSRARPDALLASLHSLHGKARGDLQILVALDPDEPADYSQVLLGHRSHPGWTSLTSVLAPERFGYAQLHRYYNLLAEHATGDWLLLWNDDAEMATDGWDQIVEGYDPSVVLSPDTVHKPMCTFPIVPRRFVQAAGHFSLNAHCDSWWEEIAKELAVLVWPEIRVEHHRADLTGENDDSVYRERLYQSQEFDAMRDLRHTDAEKIRAALAAAP